MSKQPKNNPPREQDAVYTTIVVGRPPGCGTEIGPIPRGLEVLVKKASVDDAFKALLLDKRAEAAREIGLELDPAEAAMLGVIPRAQLEATIARTRVAPENRRVFLGQAAALMLAVLGGSLLSGCKSEPGAETAAPNLTPTKTPPPVQTPTVTKIAGVRAEQPVTVTVPVTGQTIERPQQTEAQIGERVERIEIVDGIRPIRPDDESHAIRSVRGALPVRPAQPPMIDSAGTRAPQPEQPPVSINGARIERPADQPAPRAIRGTRPARPEESMTLLGIRPAPEKEK